MSNNNIQTLNALLQINYNRIPLIKKHGILEFKSNIIGDIFLNPSKSELSMIDSSMEVKPSSFTIRHKPREVWSISGSSDPLHGPWHSYLDERNIDNWESDYGKGLVLTWSNSVIGVNIDPTDKDIYREYYFENDIKGWNLSSSNIQLITSSDEKYSGKQSLNAILTVSNWGWKAINSPLIATSKSIPYRWIFYVKGENAHKVHAKIIEYDSNKKIVNAKQARVIGSGTFDWKELSFDYKPTDKRTAYIQLQIWHGHETTQSLPNKIWLDDVKVYDLTQYMEPVTLDMDVSVEKDDAYELFVRYFKNKEGGSIDIAMDGNSISRINTYDQLNKFIWKKVATLDMKKGKHKLTLTNIDGFNAVNIFALIPSEEYAQMEAKTESLLEGKRLMYVFEAESDLYREEAPVSKKYGADASNGEVLEFNENSTAWQTVSIMRGDNYTMALKLNGDFSIKIDENKYHVFSNTTDFEYIGPMYLEKGDHDIEIKQKSNITNSSDLDVIWMYSADNENETIDDVFTVNETPATVSDYEKHNPTLYSVKVDAEKPFMLSFAESYDGLWYAQITHRNGVPVKNSEKIRPVPLYSVINGFWIDETGDLEIKIEYEPQQWFYKGAAISITTLILCILYLIWDWRKSRKKAAAAMNAPPKNIMPKAARAMLNDITGYIAKAIGAIKNPFAPKDSEMAPLKNYIVHKKYDYQFRPQKKAQQKHPAPDLKELDKKAEDIKKRLMKRDKGENR